MRVTKLSWLIVARAVDWLKLAIVYQKTTQPLKLVTSMLRVYAKPFLEVAELISQLMIAVHDPNVQTFHDDTVVHITGRIDSLVVQLEVMSLEMTKISALRLRSHINQIGMTVPRCREYVHQTRDRLLDEIELTHLLSLSAEESALYEAPEPHFGRTVEAKFPSVAYDIDEAAKCLALARTTASAFHSIRCLEAAIRAMSRCLGIPDPTKASGRNWHSMLTAIKKEIDLRWPNSADRLSGDGHTFEDLYVSLAAIQNPWRNATMHLDQKYLPEEAKHIFDVVRALMNRVAHRCDEDGEPRV